MAFVLLFLFSSYRPTNGESITCIGGDGKLACDCDHLISGEHCILNCGLGDCRRDIVTCRDGDACTINCSGAGNCRAATINCPLASSCVVNCEGHTRACKDLIVNTNSAKDYHCFTDGVGVCPAAPLPYTASPTADPTNTPTDIPTKYPSTSPSKIPTISPSNDPTKMPSETPTEFPSKSPSFQPSEFPSKTPSIMPSATPSNDPTISSVAPTSLTQNPSLFPTGHPTHIPSSDPTIALTKSPTEISSVIPSNANDYDSDMPTITPTSTSSQLPSQTPVTMQPTSNISTFSTTHPITPTVTPSSTPTNIVVTPPTDSPVTPTEYSFLPTNIPSNNDVSLNPSAPLASAQSTITISTDSSSNDTTSQIATTNQAIASTNQLTDDPTSNEPTSPPTSIMSSNVNPIISSSSVTEPINILSTTATESLPTPLHLTTDDTVEPAPTIPATSSAVSTPINTESQSNDVGNAVQSINKLWIIIAILSLTVVCMGCWMMCYIRKHRRTIAKANRFSIAVNELSQSRLSRVSGVSRVSRVSRLERIKSTTSTNFNKQMSDQSVLSLSNVNDAQIFSLDHHAAVLSTSFQPGSMNDINIMEIMDSEKSSLPSTTHDSKSNDQKDIVPPTPISPFANFNTDFSGVNNNNPTKLVLSDHPNSEKNIFTSALQQYNEAVGRDMHFEHEAHFSAGINAIKPNTVKQLLDVYKENDRNGDDIDDKQGMLEQIDEAQVIEKAELDDMELLADIPDIWTRGGDAYDDNESERKSMSISMMHKAAESGSMVGFNDDSMIISLSDDPSNQSDHLPFRSARLLSQPRHNTMSFHRRLTEDVIDTGAVMDDIVNDIVSSQ